MWTLLFSVCKGFLIAAGAILVGYLFGFGAALALKHSKTFPIQVDFHANLVPQPGVEDELGEYGIELPDSLKGYHQRGNAE